ncbi:MAG TPA: tail fiber domain-containing protein, partial [Thermoanaerobaculia bacterium]|nr:tail fiber domain-containing protein [Thermoanaerobaculia bacterium]
IGMPAVWAGVAGAAKMSADPGRVQWDTQVDYERAILTVSMPGGEVVRQEFDSKQTPVFDLAAGAKDGAYTYELRLEARIDASLRKALAEARKSGDEAAMARLQAELPESPVVSGGFMVEAGSIVMNEGKEPEGHKGAKAASGSVRNVTAADQVIPDDLIVQGSTCVGFDCVNNESFGFDTIRLKENSTRIKFEDTSVGSFPTNDWQLTANDSASGGANKFSIEDITGSKVPFTITAGAATNSIFVDSTGRLGLRTSTPVLDLHINTSNTPSIRLEQNNSGGFTAQTWDIGANEANFFVRDVTGGSRLPFRIRPGAPTSSVDISADGDVGIGTASPDAKLHVLGSGGTTKFQVEETNGTATLRNLLTLSNNGGVQFLLERTDAGQNDWQISNFGASISISVPGNPTTAFSMTTNGALTIGGALTENSSREAKTNFESLSPTTVLERLNELPISVWSYKEDTARHIGPMAEDFHAAFGLGVNNKSIAPGDKAGVALAAIKGLHQVVTGKDVVITQLEQTVESLQQQNSELAARLAAIEELLKERSE